MINKPKKLNIGDTIGIIAPSSGLGNLVPHRIDNAVKNFQLIGYKVIFAKNSLKNIGYVSSIEEERADDIHEMFLNKKVKAIICMIGGNHSIQILKYLDFKLIKNNSKIFIGYSDITILHWAFFKKANLQTFYGPCFITQFGENPQILNYTYRYFKKALCSIDKIGEIIPSEKWTDETLDWFKEEDKERPRKLFKNNGYQWWKQGSVTASIIGGTIPTINYLQGSDYWIELENKILFIDIPGSSCDFLEGLSISDIDTYLAILDNIDIFKKIRGIVISRAFQYDDIKEKKLKEIILKYTNEYDYPILYNIDLGHTDPIITLPMGSMVTLDSCKNLFSIDCSGVI